MPADRHPFLEKALHNLRAAELLLEEGLRDAAVSRAYYAAFHAALAALDVAGYYSAGMSHDAVQAVFARELVNRKKVYPGTGAVLSTLMGLRHRADYDKQPVSAKQAQRQVRKAADFVRAIEQELHHDR